MVVMRTRQAATMTLLLTSDLHLHSAKLLHLLNEAPIYDAMLVAGDHLNIFAESGLDEQSEKVLRWRNQIIAASKSFAWCSGNHDFLYDIDTLMEGAAPQWMRGQPSTKICITAAKVVCSKLEAGRSSLPPSPGRSAAGPCL